MAINYTVQQGDCISSIAFEHGFFPETIWDHPSNATLKAKRKDPNILMPGDVVHVPDKRVKELNESTNQVHKYKYKGVPAKFRIQIMDDNQPRANIPYTLSIDGKIVSNPGERTTSTGMVICSISPDAREGLLVVGEGEEMVEYRLTMGHLNPVGEISGVKQRLRNLGLYSGVIDSNLTDETKDSLRAFQALQKLETTGEPDQATLDKLRNLHDGS